jgi:hypothetical protein
MNRLSSQHSARVVLLEYTQRHDFKRVIYRKNVDKRLSPSTRVNHKIAKNCNNWHSRMLSFLSNEFLINIFITYYSDCFWRMYFYNPFNNKKKAKQINVFNNFVFFLSSQIQLKKYDNGYLLKSLTKLYYIK